MKLHIVGGFLGSGKTTAITNAAKILTSKGSKVGVITNEHDIYLEENNFVNANYSPAEEVISGCFSSNLDSLNDKIVRLNLKSQPDYIFAESVGSCTDIVATVVKPMIIFNENIFESLTFSVFVDARLLLSYLKEEKLLFSNDIVYIFSKQIEEADLLIVNKIDLLDKSDFPELKRLVDKRLSNKNIITQNSFNPQNIDNWLDTLEKRSLQKRETVEIDYQIYGRGEANLTWLDEEIIFSSSKSDANEFSIKFIEKLVFDIRQNQIPIGHLKFTLMNGEHIQKISFTSIHDEEWGKNISSVPSNLVKLRVNARIETTQDIVRSIIQNEITIFSKNGVIININNSSAFKPQISIPAKRTPKPMHGCEECICLKQILARNAIRKEDGSEKAIAELESEQFECCGACSDIEGCCC